MKKCLSILTVITAGFVISLHAALPVTDDFNRSNENPLASPWTAPDGGGAGGGSNFNLSSNHLAGQGLATFQLMYYAETYPDDQNIQFTLGGTSLNLFYAGPAVRIQTSNQNGYVFGDAAGVYIIAKMVSGSITGNTLQTCPGTPTTGDVLKLDATGTTLTGFINGSSTSCVVTGETTYSSGKGGGWGYGSGPTLDDFSAASSGGSGGSTTKPNNCFFFGGCEEKDFVFFIK
jgi:hypothetical protein